MRYFVMLIQFLRVTFLTKIFPVMRCRWDFKIFSVSARKQYDEPCLNVNNSKRGGPALKFSHTWYKPMLCMRHLLETPEHLHHFWVGPPQKSHIRKSRDFSAKFTGVSHFRGRNSKIPVKLLCDCPPPTRAQLAQADITKNMSPC